MPVSKQISKYFSALAAKSNAKRTPEFYSRMSKARWDKKKDIPKAENTTLDNAHDEE
jgi:hypothetical protein